MTEHESKVWRVAIMVACFAFLALLVFANVGLQREHEEKMKALENENAHPGIWRK